MASARCSEEPVVLGLEELSENSQSSSKLQRGIKDAVKVVFDISGISAPDLVSV